MDQLKKMRDYRQAQTGKLAHRGRNVTPRGPVFWGIFSGKGGVGKSIIGVAMALHLARRGYRTLLIDTDFSLPCAQLFFNLDNFIEPVDLTADGFNFSRLATGIENLHVFTMQPQIEPAGARALRGLEALVQGANDQFDFIIFDGANGFGALHRRLIPGLSMATVTSTADPASIAGAYAMIKMVKVLHADLPLNIAFNRLNSPQHAKDAFVKINLIVKHFLHFQIPMLCWLHDDKQIAALIGESVSLEKWPESLPMLKTIGTTLQKLAPALQPHKYAIANKAKAFA